MGMWSQILCLKNQSYAFCAGVVMIFIEFESILKKKISWRNDSSSIVQSITVFWHRKVRVTVGDLMQNLLEPVEKTPADFDWLWTMFFMSCQPLSTLGHFKIILSCTILGSFLHGQRSSDTFTVIFKNLRPPFLFDGQLTQINPLKLLNLQSIFSVGKEKTPKQTC